MVNLSYLYSVFMKNPRLKDLTNKQFGKWRVICQQGNTSCGAALWLCQCDCGNKKNVIGTDLRLGKSKSCGCLQKENASKSAMTHGKSKTRLYRIWKGMRTRCTNPNYPGYKNYGGRGIIICNEWNDFIKFESWALKNGYSEDLSIERIDVNGNYEPSNCTFADASVQSANRNYTYKNKDGELWWHVARQNGITRPAYATRIFDGWPFELAATWPMYKKRPKELKWIKPQTCVEQTPRCHQLKPR